MTVFTGRATRHGGDYTSGAWKRNVLAPIANKGDTFDGSALEPVSDT